jgi:DNA primase
VIVVPDGKDPDEFIRKHGAQAFQELVQKALPLVEYRLQYVLKHINHDTLEGKVKALHAMLPVLACIRESAVVIEYQKKLSSALLLEEGIIQEELRRYGRNPQTPEEGTVASAPIRQAARQVDSALKRAGRIVLRMAWQDMGILIHLQTMVPLDSIADDNQREVLLYLQELAASRQNPNEVQAAEKISEAAMAELSRALVEDLGNRNEADAYNDAIRVLRHAYLNACYTRHARLAEEYLQAGNTAYIAELNEAKKIKSEMEELQFE